MDAMHHKMQEEIRELKQKLGYETTKKLQYRKELDQLREAVKDYREARDNLWSRVTSPELEKAERKLSRLVEGIG